MKLHSRAFEDGKHLPVQYSRDGSNLSPPLEWRDEPAAAQEFALLFETAPSPGREPFAHWLVYNIPANVTRLPAGFSGTTEPKATETPIPVTEGVNSNENARYEGPWGEVNSAQHFRFRLFALDMRLDLPARLRREDLLKAIGDHVLAEAELKTQYQRQAAA